MSIEYYVRENKLTVPISYTARPKAKAVLQYADMASRISLKIPNITPDIAENCLRTLALIIKNELLNGNTVNLTTFVSFVTTIPVRLPLSTDLLPPSRVSVVAKPSPVFTAEVAAIATYTRLGVEIVEPVIMSAADSATGLNNWMREGFMLDITGANLNFNQADQEQGLFFLSPAGNTIRAANIAWLTDKKIIAMPEIDPAEGPAGKGSVEYGIKVKARYSPAGFVKTTEFNLLRKTNVIDTDNSELFVKGSASSGPAIVSGYTGDTMTARIIAQIRQDNVLTISAGTLLGDLGQAAVISGNGTYQISGISSLEINIVDYNTLYANVIQYQRYLQEIVQLSASNTPIIIFFTTTELQNTGTPTGTGAIFVENNTNRQFISIGGNRFVWCSRKTTSVAYTIMGEVSEEGIVTFGALTETTLNNTALSSNVYGVVPIGNNKFARFRSSTTGFTLGFAVFDCGLSGLVPSLLEMNNNGVTTRLPGGWRDSILYSGGKIYMITDNNSINCTLQTIDISNISGLASNMQEINGIFGTGRTVEHISGWGTGNMAGKAIPGGGAMWLIRIAGTTTTMEMMTTANGSSINFYSCVDTVGGPMAIAIADDGVFAMAYRTADLKIRIRVGKITGTVPAFGDSFDINDGTGGMDLYPADMAYIKDGYFIFSIQTASSQPHVLFNSNGITVECEDTFGNVSATANGESELLFANSGYDGKVLLGCYGSEKQPFPTYGSRYVSMISLVEIQTPVTVLQSGMSADSSVELNEWQYFKVTAGAEVTQVVVTLNNLSADLDIYILEWALPNEEDYNDASFNGGTDQEEITIANAGVTDWYVGVYGYEAGTGTIQFILS